MPVVLDYAPITVNAPSMAREHITAGNSAWAGQPGTSSGHAGSSAPIHAAGQAAGQGGSSYDNDDHAHAVQQLHQVVNHFSYTTNSTLLDHRDTITDQSVSQNIWAHGDVEQWFDHDAVVASGDRAMAAGGDAGVRDSHNTDHSTDNSTDNSLHAGGDVSLGNEQTAISDSFNTDVGLDVDDSFNNGSDHSGHSYPDHSVSTDVDTDVRDPHIDNSGTSIHNSPAADHSFNQDSSSNTAVDVHVDDPFQDNPATSIVEHNLAAAGNQLDFTEDNPTHADVDLDHHTPIDDSVVDDSTVL
ncbi:hypothetical protein NG819_07100 [Pseudarthrobacter sp. Fe7]|nr:hypothetical protein NG819_07100 [Pseudarthrobacter sp. Fe7]